MIDRQSRTPYQTAISGSHPILSTADAGALEGHLLKGDPSLEWAAMENAGRALARGILDDFREIGGFPPDARVLLLLGKGHNGGDACLAAHTLRIQFPALELEAALNTSPDTWKPLAIKAWATLNSKARVVATPAGAYDLVIDGLYGFSFRPPLDLASSTLLSRVNQLPIRFRAAVDLPSGLDDAAAFRADFTYATGIVKETITRLPNAGRLRYLDLGFFNEPTSTSTKNFVLTPDVLWPLKSLRPALSDKRHHGRVFVVAGSMTFPGAAMMAALGAIYGGAGLVTAFVPADLVPAFSARLPEVIWVGLPVGHDGQMGADGLPCILPRLTKTGAWVMGPGLGPSRRTLPLLSELLKQSELPAVLDADALHESLTTLARGPLILTPHEGEYLRLGPLENPRHVTVRKGPFTRIYSEGKTYHSFFGGPVLARGGSGDILAGMMGALLAQSAADPIQAAARALVWHGLAADALARARGSVSVKTTDLLHFLGPVLTGERQRPTRIV